MAKFHAQLWQFWKSARISETAARTAKISSILTLWGRKRVGATPGKAKFQAQIWQIWKSVRISETASSRAKIGSISTIFGRKQVL